MPPSAMPWYRSTVIIGALVSIISKVLVMTGLIGDIAPGDQEQLVSIIVLLAGGLGDLFAITARVRQKHAPAITGSTTIDAAGRVVPVFLALLLLPAMLGGCATLPPPAPATAANQTTLDEQAGRLVNIAYTAAAKAAALSIQTGLVRDPATVKRIGELDQRAFAAVQAVNRAYKAANASSYMTALTEARAAIEQLVSAVTGDKP